MAFKRELARVAFPFSRSPRIEDDDAGRPCDVAISMSFKGSRCAVLVDVAVRTVVVISTTHSYLRPSPEETENRDKKGSLENKHA